ncbi:helix-turn-helix domain-containing protein [Lysobacter sp. CA199]|uniref:helix-turn-helix domain-containing protein n=1 Tax=Lysobacter sp. CA199 TaxID=3455608 RepID=UPI003F8D7E57
MNKVKKQFPPEAPAGVNAPPVQSWLQYGSRLIHIRGSESQATFAPKIGVHKNTLGHYERGTREVGADALRSLVYLGWNANWLLTGEGAERIGSSSGVVASQDERSEIMRMAVELIDSELEKAGKTLPRDKRAKAYTLIYELLMEPGDLPSASVVQLTIKAVT